MKWLKKEPKIPYLDSDDMITKLAKINGITVKIKDFLKPKTTDMHSPHLMKNLVEAAQAIVHAIKKGEKIVIHIDPDNDGVTSGTIMFQYLRSFTNNISYIHAQRSDGHGVELSENDIPVGTQLLIIIDSSTNEVESCRRISESGVDIIVLDHHIQDVANPYCLLVNPQQQGCNYPNKYASGAVVAWKVCQAIDELQDVNFSKQFYDLCAIGLYGDMMNMLEPENRYIVNNGLKNIANVGIKSLLAELKIDLSKLKSSDIGYSIAPCINAACRLDRIEEILGLLNENNMNVALTLAKNIITMNEERKTVQAIIAEGLSPFVDKSKPLTIIIKNNIGKGYRGLVCGDLADRFKVCIMILSDDGETYSGSFRSFNDFNLKNVLESIPEITFTAGHGGAGGVGFLKSDLHIVTDKLNQLLENNLKEQNILYDMVLNLSDLTEDLIKDVENFYLLNGNGFKTGNFLVNNITISDVKIMGKGNNTLKLAACPTNIVAFCDKTEEYANYVLASLMKFRTKPEYFPANYVNKQIEVVGELNLNAWTIPNTKKVIKTNQIFIQDFRLIT